MDITYDFNLVILSAIIAIAAGYFTIEMSTEITFNKGLERVIWLGISSITMGMGIWGMHFIAMTAFSMGLEISYNFPIVLLSLLAAIAGCAQGLFIITQPYVNNLTLIAGAITMGSAIAGMHYIGMAAMRVGAKISYEPSLLILSIVIAIAVSLVAIKLTIALRTSQNRQKQLWKKVFSSLLMGGAVLSMHYTGMAAARFKIDSSIVIEKANVLDNDVLGLCIALAIVGIFAMVYVILFNSSLNRST